MTHPNDVPPSMLLPKLATELRSRKAVAPPPWATFAKTGVHKQRAPTQTDWWYLRSASVLRKIYLKGYIGIERLSAEYGGSATGAAPRTTLGPGRVPSSARSFTSSRRPDWSSRTRRRAGE